MKETTRDAIKSVLAVILFVIYGIMTVFVGFFLLFKMSFSMVYEVVFPFKVALWTIYACGIIGTYILLVKVKDIVKKPITLILVLVLVFGADMFATLSANKYFSAYTREKWDKYPLLRSIMTDDLQSKYNLIGMTEEEVTEILGEPDYIQEDDGRTMLYVIGRAMIDPYVFFVDFEDGVVVDTHESSYG